MHELLVGRLGVQPLGVPGLQLRGGDHLGHALLTARRHQRLRRPQARVGHRRGRTVVTEHRHHGLARAQRGEQLLEVVRGVRVGAGCLAQGLLVVRRERAQGVLHPVAQLRQDAVGQVGGHLRHEEHAHALGADEAHGVLDRLPEGLAGVLEQQVRLVQEEDQLRLLGVAHLGEVVEQVGQQPHQEGREQLRVGLHAGQLETGDDPQPVLGGAQEVRGVELRLAEERVGRGAEGHELAQDHPRRGLGQRPQPLEVRLALGRHEVLDDGPQVAQVHQGQPVAVGVVEDQAEAGLLDLGEPQHLAQQGGAEGGHRGAHRHPRPLVAQAQELHRRCGGAPLLADRCGALGDLLPLLTGQREPREVSLDVGEEDRHPGGGELLGHDLERLGLAGSGGTGHQAVAVERGQRQAHRQVSVGLRALHGGPEDQRRPLEGVPGADLLEQVRGPGVGGVCAHVVSSS